MSTGKMDPFGFSLNGEPASHDDIVVMEQLAWSLVEPEPAEVGRYYAYENLGCFVVFATTEIETDDIDSTMATIRLANSHIDNVNLQITFGYDNDVAECAIPTGDELTAAIAVSKVILASGDLNPKEKTILKYLQKVLHFRDGLAISEVVGANSSPGHHEIGDLIRYLVEDNTRFGVRAKEFSLPIATDQLMVLQQQISGEDEDIDVSEFPVLQVEYRDNDKELNYCYTLYDDNDRTLEVMPLSELIEPDTADYEEEVDGAVIELMAELDASVPGKRDVDLLIEKLIEASLANAPS